MSADSLPRLTTLLPDPERAERVRVKCRAGFAQRARRQRRAAAVSNFAWRVLAPVVVGVSGVLYLAVVVATTLRLKGVF